MLEDLGKLIVAKGFKKLPKVQKIARSGHTEEEEASDKNQSRFASNLDAPQRSVYTCVLSL